MVRSGVAVLVGRLVGSGVSWAVASSVGSSGSGVRVRSVRVGVGRSVGSCAEGRADGGFGRFSPSPHATGPNSRPSATATRTAVPGRSAVG
nr:hypothetical protein GCM10020092_052880 [Actinoplanes digitatis]